MTALADSAETITFTGVIPYLNLSDANAASAFYAKAFGAVEIDRRPAEDGKRLMHCAVNINGGYVFFCDPFPEWGHPVEPPQAYVLHLQVDDIDAWFKRATDAGCEVALAVHDAFWGDRYGQVKDPFGVKWSFGQSPAV
jgi:PhnB protein